MALETLNDAKIVSSARDLAAWIAAQPDGAVTLRQVQREAPSRSARRDALAVLAAAEAMGLLVPLPPGFVVGGVPRRQAWAVSGQAAPDSPPASLPAAAATVRQEAIEACDMDRAEVCDMKAQCVRHEPEDAIVRHGEPCDTPVACDTSVRHGLYPDAAALLGHLRRTGPATHTEAAAALGWEAMRAWRAADRLSRIGLVHYPAGAGTMHVKD